MPAALDPQQAFRDGVFGRPFSRAAGKPVYDGAFPLPGGDGPGLHLHRLSEGQALGPGEMVALGTRRLSGLNDPRHAYETGRALVLIARLFDQAKAPARVTEQFRDNLAAAVIGNRCRPDAAPWSLDDTLEMFTEMYRRFGRGGEDERAVREFVRERARLPKPSFGQRWAERLNPKAWQAAHRAA